MKKVNRFLLWLCKMILIIMVPSMTIVVFAQVVMRYVFLAPLSWVEEMAKFLLVWISCFGAAYGLNKGEHISILFISSKFKGYTKSFVTLLIHVLMIAFFVVCVVEGIGLSLAQWNQRSPSLEIPMTLPYFCVPVSFGIMIMFSLEMLLQDVKTIFSGKSVPNSLEHSKLLN